MPNFAQTIRTTVLAATAFVALGTASALADPDDNQISIGGDATVTGTNDIQTVTAIGEDVVAIGEVGVISGNVTIEGDANVNGTNEIQTVIGIGSGVNAYGGVGTISGNVQIGGDATVTGSSRIQTVVGIGSNITAAGTVGGIVSRY